MVEQREYDVCFLLEGTYPYVMGGVSSWVHNLIKALPELQFVGLCLLPSSKESYEKKFEEPENYTHLDPVFLHDYDLDKKGEGTKQKKLEQIALMRTFHTLLAKKEYSFFENILPVFQDSKTKGLLPHDIIYGKEAWKLIVDLYKEKRSQESFIDYFWTFRFTHLPLFKILGAKIPRARVYHAVSTGYAGLMGVMARYLYRRPLLLTEHGIYTKERKIEIAQAEWIYVSEGERIKMQRDLGTFQKMWIQLFESLGRIIYQEADQIITLYEGNRVLEIEGGADPDKTIVIPNGINLERFKGVDDLPKEKKVGEPYYVGFVGRVVPIKDVKTFLRACKIVSVNIPNVKFLIIGPTEEDQEYYRECQELVNLLRLHEFVEFTGRVDMMEYYPRLDLIVLTSVSEAQPLVILEAACVGVPCVASDVGSCRELLEGQTEADKALGPSGMVTQVSNPTGTAQGIIKILSDHELRHKMSLAGKKRVGTFYRESDLNRKYREIYNELGEGPDLDNALEAPEVAQGGRV